MTNANLYQNQNYQDQLPKKSLPRRRLLSIFWFAIQILVCGRGFSTYKIATNHYVLHFSHFCFVKAWVHKWPISSIFSPKQLSHKLINATRYCLDNHLKSTSLGSGLSMRAKLLTLQHPLVETCSSNQPNIILHADQDTAGCSCR